MLELPKFGRSLRGVRENERWIRSAYFAPFAGPLRTLRLKGFLTYRRWLISIAILVLALPACFAADDTDTPLGDIARAFRREKKEDKDKNAPQHNVIDNENLDQLMNELQSKKFNSTSLLFSFDGVGKSFKVSAPDVTCNLSFNAKATSLLSDPFMPREVPGGELAKLDGPAVLEGSTLQVSVYNGSAWNIKELIVGVTMLRAPVSTPYGPAMKPAVESVVELSEKRPDQTVIYHLRGTAAPQSTTVFTADLAAEPSPDQEWHWAIVGAKGVPAEPTATTNPLPSGVILPAVPTEEQAPATSSGNLHP